MQFDQLKRREFITMLGNAAAGWPLAARAQQPERVRRIGVLGVTLENDPQSSRRAIAFERSLEKLGWTVGRNLQIDYRWGASDNEEARAAAEQLMGLGSELVVANSPPPGSARSAAGVPHGANHICGGERTDGSGVGCEHGQAGWKRHWLHQSGAECGGKVGGATQGNCPPRQARRIHV